MAAERIIVVGARAGIRPLFDALKAYNLEPVYLEPPLSRTVLRWGTDILAVIVDLGGPSDVPYEAVQ